jgi:hypothetical protein
MVGRVGPRDVSALVARQLHVDLPPALVMLEGGITDFGEFKVGVGGGGWQQAC